MSREKSLIPGRTLQMSTIITVTPNTLGWDHHFLFLL